jgi:hypothetical protein
MVADSSSIAIYTVHIKTQERLFLFIKITFCKENKKVPPHDNLVPRAIVELLYSGLKNDPDCSIQIS